MGIFLSVWNKAYHVQHRLGQGSFGIVYKVTDGLGQVYALKHGQVQNKQVQNELEVLTYIGRCGTHKNIIQLVDSGASPNMINGVIYTMPFIVLEYCDHGDLDSYIRGHPLEPVEPFMKDMIDGMCYLHGLGLAHRDLKPANILMQYSPIMKRPICKIADFGTSTQQQTDLILGSYLSTYCGTKAFMAPEVGQGPYKRSCDIFSLGAIFLVLYTRETHRNGNQHFLEPTMPVFNRSTCTWEQKFLREAATDEDISSAVMRQVGADGTLKSMICSMLTKDFRVRANIATVNQMFSHYENQMSVISSRSMLSPQYTPMTQQVTMPMTSQVNMTMTPQLNMAMTQQVSMISPVPTPLYNTSHVFPQTVC